MIPDPTPEKLAGILQAEKERKERCERIQEAWEKKQKQEKIKELTEEEIKYQEEQERIRQWINADLTKKKK